MAVREAIDRYLNQRAIDATENSIGTWRYQLKLFAEFCDARGIERVDEIHGYDLDDFYSLRANAVAPSTLEGDMWTLRTYVQFLERREAVEDGLAEKVNIPDVDEADRSSDQQLDPSAAIELIRHFRSAPAEFGKRHHALLELAWFSGARQGCLRALDLRDVHFDDHYVEFHHRPETGTPLKNKTDGERPVAFPPGVLNVVERFVDDYRYDVHDDHGRAPLLASRYGRPTNGTIRDWSYMATQPCVHGPCPHDRERETCEFTLLEHASKCPSSRSPHRIRTGSIGWQLDLGLPPWVVAERVNATLEVIERHYDKTSPVDRMERRRRPFIDDLALDLEEDTGDSEP